MNRLRIAIAPAALLVVLGFAGGCTPEAPPGSREAGTTASTAAARPSDQIAEGAGQVGEGLEKAGRGVAQATGEALQQAGRELAAAGTPEGEATPQPTEAVPARPAGAGSPLAGGRLFAAKSCDGCHGINGAGGTPIARKQNIPPLGSPAVQALSDAELARILTEGKSSASAAAHKSKELTPPEVRDLIAWIRTL